MQNNPVRYNDPTGHKLADDLYGTGGSSGMTSGSSKPQTHNKNDDKDDEVDAVVASGNFVMGAGPFVAAFGIDFVFNRTGFVMFVTGASNFPGDPGSVPYPSPDVFLTPQFGGSGTAGILMSSALQPDSTLADIKDAFSGRARQEGFTLPAGFTWNSSFSADSNGDLNNQTTTRSVGHSSGVPDIVAEYHRYDTVSKSTNMELTWERLEKFLKEPICISPWCY